MTLPTERFTGRAGIYHHARPRYPDTLLASLVTEAGLRASDVIADVGSGTGISTELFLLNGNKVFAVEPNDEMRLTAENLLTTYKNFISVNGTAEATTLANASIDMIVAGQAYHWFDREAALQEFRRILKPDGWVAFFWNFRVMAEKGFAADYEALIQRYSTDYKTTGGGMVDWTVELRKFFPGSFIHREFPNLQRLDREGLKQRWLSCSYIPLEHDERAPKMLEELDSLFDRYQSDGEVIIHYETHLNCGKI